MANVETISTLSQPNLKTRIAFEIESPSDFGRFRHFEVLRPVWSFRIIKGKLKPGDGLIAGGHQASHIVLGPISQTGDYNDGKGALKFGKLSSRVSINLGLGQAAGLCMGIRVLLGKSKFEAGLLTCL